MTKMVSNVLRNAYLSLSFVTLLILWRLAAGEAPRGVKKEEELAAAAGQGVGVAEYAGGGASPTGQH